MEIIDLRVKLVQSLEQQIKKELSELQIPSKVVEKENKLLSGRKKDDLLYNFGSEISETEADTLRNLTLNNCFRLREFERAMGMLLLFSSTVVNTSTIELLNDPETFRRMYDDGRDHIAAYTEFFWTSYGDFNIKSCSLLDSIGVYLAFAFFGLMDAPLYFDQVLKAIKLKFTYGKRTVIQGDPFKLEGRESWEILCDARKRYDSIKNSRNELIHVFSPLMYRLTDSDDLDYKRRQVLRYPEHNVKKILEQTKKNYFSLWLVPLAAHDLAHAFIGTASYHRDFYF